MMIWRRFAVEMRRIAILTKGADGGLNGVVDTPLPVAQKRLGPEDASGPNRCSNYVCRP